MPNESNDKMTPSFKTEFHKIIDIEVSSIKSSLSLQKYIYNTILSISDVLWNMINSSSDINLIHDISKDLYDISNFSLQIQSTISSLEKLETKLETLNKATTNIELDDNLINNINQCHDESSNLIEQSLNLNSSFNDFITKFSKINYLSHKEIYNNNNNNENKNENFIKNNEENSNDNNDNNGNIGNIEESNKTDNLKKILYIPDNLKENTLVISDSEVLLPFTKDELEEKLNSSNLDSCRQVINTFYRKPKKYFEPSSISRFREAYSLVKNKEHGSKFQALSLALELSTNYNLHPAIISACKDLTQLDVYLSCLEYKELSDFHFFDIVYNIPPTPKKRIFKKIIENI